MSVEVWPHEDLKELEQADEEEVGWSIDEEDEDLRDDDFGQLLDLDEIDE